jgi:hypothetical protein
MRLSKRQTLHPLLWVPNLFTHLYFDHSSYYLVCYNFTFVYLYQNVSSLRDGVSEMTHILGI